MNNLQVRSVLPVLERCVEKRKRIQNFLLGERNAKLTQKEDLQEKILALNETVLEQCAVLLQKMSAHRREQTRKQLEQLGTMALQLSLGPEYELILEVSEEKKKPVIEPYVLHLPTALKSSPTTENGGGIVDILAIAMRAMMLQMQSDPAIDGPIILDEPFKMVSEEYVPMIVTFLEKIAKDFGRQILLITHNNHLAETCSTVIEMSHDAATNESSAVTVRYEELESNA